MALTASPTPSSSSRRPKWPPTSGTDRSSRWRSWSRRSRARTTGHTPPSKRWASGRRRRKCSRAPSCTRFILAFYASFRKKRKLHRRLSCRVILSISGISSIQAVCLKVTNCALAFSCQNYGPRQRRYVIWREEDSQIWRSFAASSSGNQTNQ